MGLPVELVEQLARQAKRAEKTASVNKLAKQSVAAQEAATTRAGESVNARAQALYDEFKSSQTQIDEVEDLIAVPPKEPTFIERNKARKVRDIALFDPEAGVTHRFQTTRQEFKKRLDSQLRDLNFSMEASYGVLSDSILRIVGENRAIDNAFQVRAKRALNGRAGSRASEWAEDSPYETQVMVHVDRQTDPLRANTSDTIQFEEPREMGLHSGTNEVAMGATIKSTSGAAFQIDDFNESLIELEKRAGWEEGSIESLVGKAIEQHFISKFAVGSRSGGKTMTPNEIETMWDNVEQELQAAFREADLPEKEATKIMARSRQLPTSNSTPHLFRGKNGLYMEDRGGWGAETTGGQLIEIFNNQEDTLILDEILSKTGAVAKQKGLQQFIEDKGFDHIIYHNKVEDRGSLSIINWNPDLWMSLYDDAIQGGSDAARASAFAAVTLGAMGFGEPDGSVQQ